MVSTVRQWTPPTPEYSVPYWERVYQFIYNLCKGFLSLSAVEGIGLTANLAFLSTRDTPLDGVPSKEH